MSRFSFFNLFLVSLLAIISSCKKDNEDKSDFERGPMLENFQENIITVRYNNMDDALNELSNAFDAFENSTNVSNLNQLKTAFKSAYTSWQSCSSFEFGPAMDVALKASMNTFPTDTAKILSNIDNGSYNLNSASNTNATGFPALDYLFFRYDEAQTINTFTTGTNSTELTQYVNDIIAKMQSDLTSVVNEWNGSYATTFKKATGKDVGSSTGLLVNAMNKDFELIKKAEIGIPLGKQSLDVTRPTYVQAYYSEISNELSEAHLQSIQELYNGVSTADGNNGIGFDDYLEALDARASDETGLDEKINGQFNTISNKANLISSTYSDAVDSENAAMNDYYEEIQKSVVYLKTDLASSIGVVITYQDNDGD